jgi:glyoxylase-like metal-dependent hydrolase (beta-lactamase superfamily II)
MKLEILRMPPENTNSVLVSANGAAVIFDPWGRAQDWENLLGARGLDLKSIYATHGHYDHISAVAGLVRKIGADWFMHPADLPLIEWSNQIFTANGMTESVIDIARTPPLDLRGGEIEILPGIRANVIETPGHSAGGVAFVFREQGVLIIGDTLFQDGIGRYDLPGGSLRDLRESIAKIHNMNLPDDTLVVHGHGDNTTIGWLRRGNRGQGLGIRW